MANFILHADYQPTGDQPEAISSLVSNIQNGMKEQTLRGATGTGKTFTIANVIASLGKKTLILSHNKTLAGQLYGELKRFFPENHVEFFISYYDYYQPEAYVPKKDLFIEKDSDINDDIDQMRHSAVSSLLAYDDVIVVASVSCIYGVGDPEDYRKSMLTIHEGDIVDPRSLARKLIAMGFERNDVDFTRGTFRSRGGNIEVIPKSEKESSIRIEFFGNQIESIKMVDVVTHKPLCEKTVMNIFPATFFAVSDEKRAEAVRRIRAELADQVALFKKEGKLLEAERIAQRTNYDLEMIEEVGSCSGIENYSRHMALRDAGSEPYTLLDFLGKDFLMVVDESHVTLPQVRGMYNGDRARKQTLVDYGFRLPSALDNRPLTFDEFKMKLGNVIYMSATPADYERDRSGAIVDQVIRPTGLVDPEVLVEPATGQIDDLVRRMSARRAANERTLVCTLTIKMAEDLAKYLKEVGFKVAYLHSEVKSFERLELLRGLRSGKYDALVGINLLREGLDLPEVSLIAILDADKEGFLRSATSLIQIIGRAARNVHGEVILYADAVTGAMEQALSETYRRRTIQEAYNKAHGITPRTITRALDQELVVTRPVTDVMDGTEIDLARLATLSLLEKKALVAKLELEMKKAAKDMNYEEAMMLRDVIFEIRADGKKE